MELWAKYFISNENYDDWGDPVRYFEGVYTSKAVEEDKNHYYNEGYKQCEKVLKALNQQLENLTIKRDFFNTQMKELLKDKSNTKQKRIKLQKEIEKVNLEFKDAEANIKKYEDEMNNRDFCIEVGLKRNGIVYEKVKVEFVATDYEKQILELFCI